MNKCYRLIWYAIILLLVLSYNYNYVSAAAGEKRSESTITKLIFSHVKNQSKPMSVAYAINYKVSAMYPDNTRSTPLNTVENGVIWEGPMIIQDTKSAKYCTFDLSLITDVYYDNSTNTFIAVTHDGSMTYLQFLDINTCTIVKFLEVYTSRITVDNNLISIYPGCENSGKGWSQCSSGIVLMINSEHYPVILEKESFELTKKVIGVGFKGDKKVVNPKTKKAKILQH